MNKIIVTWNCLNIFTFELKATPSSRQQGLVRISGLDLENSMCNRVAEIGGSDHNRERKVNAPLPRVDGVALLCTHGPCFCTIHTSCSVMLAAITPGSHESRATKSSARPDLSRKYSSHSMTASLIELDDI